MQGGLTAEHGFEVERSAPRIGLVEAGLPHRGRISLRSLLHRTHFPLRAFCLTLGLVLTLGLGSASLLVNAVGIVSPMDFRPAFDEPLLPYREAIIALDQSFHREGVSEQFLAEVTHIVDQTTAYEKRPDLRRIPAKENWILWGLSYLQPVLNYTGLLEGPGFQIYQAMSYEMALKRGFGACNQLALAVSDLLNTRYGIQTAVLSLGGHVVALAQLPDGSQHILDSTVGVFLPYGPEEAAQRIAEFEPLYRERGWGELALTFDADRNVIYPRGGKDLEANSYYLEVVSIFLKWFAPVVLVLLGALIVKFGFRHVVESPAGHGRRPPVPAHQYARQRLADSRA
jgi:hypothetical protein